MILKKRKHKPAVGSFKYLLRTKAMKGRDERGETRPKNSRGGTATEGCALGPVKPPPLTKWWCCFGNTADLVPTFGLQKRDTF